MMIDLQSVRVTRNFMLNFYSTGFAAIYIQKYVIIWSILAIHKYNL